MASGFPMNAALSQNRSDVVHGGAAGQAGDCPVSLE